MATASHWNRPVRNGRRGCLPILAAVILLWSGPGKTSAKTRLVPQVYPTIQNAIDNSANRDTVLISPGIYRGSGNRNIDLKGKDIVITSQAGADQTIIDCQNAGRGFNVGHFEPSTACIQGLTIENGNSLGLQPDDDGGGILCDTASPVIRNCKIINCTGDEGGGLALYVYGSTVSGCVISGNSGRRGGGMYVYFDSGTVITDCVITGNNGKYGGGGILVEDQELINNCTISANYSEAGGGGMLIGQSTLERSIVWGNCSPGLGAQLYSSGGSGLTCTDIDSTGVYTESGAIQYDPSCIYSDPMFCGAVACSQTTAGDWTLNSLSLCLPQRSLCGQLIGAEGQGCSDPSGVPGQTRPPEGSGLSAGRPDPSAGRIAWQLQVPSRGWLSAKVVDVLGSRIKSWALGQVPAGGTTIVWDGRNSRGAAAAPGRYFLIVTAAGGRSWSAPATIVR